MSTMRLENELLELWKKLIGSDGIEVDEEFFNIGGTSLIAAQLFGEIALRYKVRLPYTVILEAPTIRKLAAYIQTAYQDTQKSVLVDLKGGDKGILFLVHDGLGETLLYKNLVSRMPEGLGVYGIQPKTKPRIPMMHTDLRDMAEYYVGVMRHIQPHGPYLIGGLCAGGVIGYLMAEKLAELNESVHTVIVLDAAAPHVEDPIEFDQLKRAERFQSMLDYYQKAKIDKLTRYVNIGFSIIKKSFNYLFWRLNFYYRRLLIVVLEIVLKYDLNWPGFLPTVTVLETYYQARTKYKPNPRSSIRVLLVRATEAKTKDVDDVPCCCMYKDEVFGWNTCTDRLDILDIDGGHSSILREPYVEALANKLKDIFVREGLKFE